jgi:hypothetical protein
MKFYLDVPLEIIWSRVLVLTIRTKWTNITWTLVDKTMSYHLILSLEAFSALGSWAIGHWAIVWSIG